MTGLIVLFVLVLAVALLAVSVKAVRAANLHAAYMRLSSQYAGTFQRCGAFGPPVIRFARRGMSGSVGIVKPNGVLGGRFTQVVVSEKPLPEFLRYDSPHSIPPPVHGAPPAPDAFTCEITPAGLMQRVTYLVGGRTGLADSAQFNLNYSIETNDPGQARQFLTRYVQMQVDRLRYFQGGNDIFVRFHAGELTVRRRGVIRNERVLRQFTDHALELFEQAIASYAGGIDFVASTHQPETDAICKVCGDPLREEVVYCRICDTPHHRDCWRYFGGCSVYGCGERRFVRAPRLSREKA